MKYLSRLFAASLLSIFLFFPAFVHATSIGNVNLVSPRGSCGNNQVETALGCISTEVDTSGSSFFSSIIDIAVGLGGGLALLLMLYGVFIVTTSAGIPDKLKEGQEIITSAVSGLIFILLSVFLLNFIGIKVLSLPGLQ